MAAENLSKTEQLILLLINNYHKEVISDDTIMIFQRGVSDLDPALLENAIYFYIATNDWFPSAVSVLRKLVKELQDTEQQALLQDRKALAKKCRMCDEIGFRFVDTENFKGVKRCSHNRRIENQYKGELIVPEMTGPEEDRRGLIKTMTKDLTKGLLKIRKVTIPQDDVTEEK